VDLAVLDIECYYDSDYTLKKLTVEEYVRDPRFKTHCVSIYRPSMMARPQIVPTDTLGFWTKGATVVAQNAAFDGLILSHHYGVKPDVWIDTLSMARAVLPQLKSHSLSALAAHYGLPAKTIDYQAFMGRRDLDEQTYNMLADGCCWDVGLTYLIALRLLKSFPKSELPVVDLTLRMFAEGCISLDAPMAQAELDRIKAAKANALNSLGCSREDLQSSAKFSELLTAAGCETPMKHSAKQNKDIPALAKTDQGMKDLMEHPDPRVSALAAARLGEKSTLMETRLERLISMNERGALCLALKYWGAGNTGRWSGGGKINAQNFPPAIQRALVAPDGFKFVKVDSAQIECRLLNYFAGQEDVVEKFRSGRDVYAEAAADFYGRPITKADKAERFLFKVLELSAGYGVGAARVKIGLAQGALGGDPVFVTEEEAKALVQTYRSTHPKVVALWRKYDKWLDQMYRSPPEQRRFVLPNGTWLDWSELRYDGKDYYRGDQKVWGGLVVENLIQALGRVLMAEIMVRVKNLYPEYKLILTTHDDLVYLVPEEDKKALERIGEQFKIPPTWAPNLPLSYDGYEGKRYSDPTR
jgi:DNA polymerase